MIPEQDYFLSADKPLPLLQELQEGCAVAAARLGAGEQACLGTIPAPPPMFDSHGCPVASGSVFCRAVPRSFELTVVG
jgi:hypothetical protein